MGDPGGTYERGSVSGNMLIIRPTTAPTSQTNPQDDTIIFCEVEEGEITNVKRILRCFEAISGLKINFHRSVTCGVGKSKEVTQLFATQLNCLCQKLPIKYLGMPLGANPWRRKTWQPVVEKIKAKLAMWRRRQLSFAGKWWWRYGNEDEALWKKAIASKCRAVWGRWLPDMEASENGNFGVKKILEAKAVCRVCFEPVRGDAINICECSCPLLDLKCRYWVPDSAKCGYCKKEYQKIYVTVEPEQIPQGRQKRGLVSALKSGIHRLFSCASSPRVD